MVSVDEDRRDFPFASLPVPVREYVQGLRLRIPAAPVQPVPVLRYACQVYDAEHRRVVGPVGVVRGRFPEIVETCPHEFTDAVRQVILQYEVIFRQVRPVTAFQIVGGRLVVRIFLHRAPLYRELVHAAGADCGCRLAPQKEFLGKTGIIGLIPVRPVVEARDIHHGHHVVGCGGIRIVYPLGHRPGRVFPVADVLKHESELRAHVSVSLVRHFIPYAPHHHTRTVPVVTDEIHQILLHPFVEKLVVAVRHLRRDPFVERLRHQHHPHLVTRPHQLRRRHVVRGPYRIAAHILQQPYLPPDTGIVRYASKRPQVVVVAHSTELDPLPVQEKAFSLPDLHCPDTEHRPVFVLQLIPFVYFRHRGVQCRCLGCPQPRVPDYELLTENAAVKLGPFSFG